MGVMEKQYQDNFNARITVLASLSPRAYKDWCLEHVGKELKDWYMFYPDGDSHPILHIRDPKMATLFRLIWSEYIL